MEHVTGCELISVWQQSIGAQSPSCNAVLSYWHDMGKKTLQTCTLLNDINSCLGRTMTDVAITVREEGQRPSSWDGLFAVSALQGKYNTYIT
jgi:hypothetical protein